MHFQVVTDHRNNKVLSYTAMPRPLTWSYGSKDDPEWKLHTYNEGYRTEEETDPRFIIPERRFQHIAVPYIVPGFWKNYTWSEYIPNPCRVEVPHYNATLNITYPYTNYTCPPPNYVAYHECPVACNVTKWKMVWHERERNMYIYGGFGGAKKTDDVTVQKQTYFMSDLWKCVNPDPQP